MIKTKQKLPLWFNGTVYEQGEEVTNQFSGQSIDLTAEELSMYDFIMGSQMILEIDELSSWNKNIQLQMSKGLNWFRNNNAEAYMVLLD